MRFGRRYVSALQITVVFIIGLYTLIHIRNAGQTSTLDHPPPLEQRYQKPPYYFDIKLKDGQNITIEEVLTDPRFPSLEQRMNFTPSRKQKLILAIDTGHSEANLQGCPDWNCAFSGSIQDFHRADVVMIRSGEIIRDEKRKPNQYIVFFSQESPVHTFAEAPTNNFFNLSLSYRHDSLGSSPYGYTVKLARESRQLREPVINDTLIRGKSKAIAWFVSHCNTPSSREKLVTELQRFIPVDVYGNCGNLTCKRGGSCEDMLDNDYYFYIAFENSVCEDYITEKLWNQGYQRNIIPIVLKRSIVEPYVPPKSFVAVDDYATLEDLATELFRIMNDKALYVSYFEWRRSYKVIFLDGEVHDTLERPWGFCQLCRLAHQEPRPKLVMGDFNESWKESCEKDGELVFRFLKTTNPRQSIRNYQALRLKAKIVESALKIT